MQALGATIGLPLANATTRRPLQKREWIFTAEPFELRSAWPEVSNVPVERRWGFLGTGICPMPQAPRRRARRRNATDLLSCLEACGATPRCRSAAFSQTRRRCLLGWSTCDLEDLSWYMSYATFVPIELVEKVIPRTRVEVGEGSEEPLRVYASVTSHFGPMLNSFISSMHMASERATVLLHTNSDKNQASYTASGTNRSWPSTPEDIMEMRRRDHMKVNMLIRTVWDSFSAGVQSAVFSDVDVQVFPDWTHVVRVCTLGAHLCLLQQPGLYNKRRRPFNSGFLAFRVDMISVAFVLSLGAQFEPVFLVIDPERLFKVYPVDQDVLSQYVFEQGAWFWAAFNPDMMQVFVDSIPYAVNGVKVQHAAGSHAGNRLMSLYRTRRRYYSIFSFCLSRMYSGPQHPCCVVYGYQRSIFFPEFPRRLPPFRRGSIFGAADDDYSIALRTQSRYARSLPGATAEQTEYWEWACESDRHEGMYTFQLEHPQDDFLEGRIRPLPPGFDR